MSLNIPGFALQPSATRVPTTTNYMTSFDFLNLDNYTYIDKKI